MTTWIFVFSAVAFGQGTAFTTGFSSEEARRSYGQDHVMPSTARGVRTAECVGLRNGKVIDFTSAHRRGKNVLTRGRNCHIIDSVATNPSRRNR